MFKRALFIITMAAVAQFGLRTLWYQAYVNVRIGVLLKQATRIN